MCDHDDNTKVKPFISKPTFQIWVLLQLLEQDASRARQHASMILWRPPVQPDLVAYRAPNLLPSLLGYPLCCGDGTDPPRLSGQNLQ